MNNKRNQNKEKFTAHCSPKTAFTLAEILITLAIIGIVAALTIPNLIINYQKKQTVTKLKQTYSILNQAYQLSSIDNGSFSKWSLTNIDGEDFLNKYFKPYLKLHDCTKNNHDLCGYSSNTPFKFLNGDLIEIGLYDPNKTFLLLYNGVFILTFPYIDTLNTTQAYIYIDVNNSAPPNIAGKDVFRLTITDNGIRFDGYNLDLTSIINRCKTNGIYCGALIERENWQITDNYPE